MPINSPLMLSTSVLRPASVGARARRPHLISKGELDAVVEPHDDDADGQSHVARRTRIWQLDNSLHCSIVGTCLSTAELRHILGKLNVGDAGAASDHELHTLGVMLASRREGGAKLLQKALDRRHGVAVSRYSRAKDPAALLSLWEESLKQGDIPGAYWAVLAHPAATDEIVKRVFGDVHMLSHLVGAANRADIRRLRQLEEENAALAAKVERQQRQLHEGFTTRDSAIRRLNEMLALQAADRPQAPDSQRAPEEGDAVESLIRDLNKRLARETARHERSDRRLSELSEDFRENERALQAARRECEEVLRELELVEAHLAALAQPQAPELGESLALAGLVILYVGGRAHQVPQLKGLIERAGGRLLHHDGGIEHSAGLLPGLVSRADRVLFPIDCVSHDAATNVKRLCRQAGKPYEPLRTASLACLLSALSRIGAPGETVAAE